MNDEEMLTVKDEEMLTVNDELMVMANEVLRVATLVMETAAVIDPAQHQALLSVSWIC